MKFMEIPSIIKTNLLFSKLSTIDPQQALDLEVYSCKPTKTQKAHKNIPKPLKYYVSTLEEVFAGYDFSSKSMKEFKSINYITLKKELSFVFLTIYKNNGDVMEMLGFIDTVFCNCVNMKNALIYKIVDIAVNEGENCNVFLIHGKKEKRVIIIKHITRMMQ